MIDRYYRQYTVSCDYCGETLPGEESYSGAIRAAREAGWEARKNEFGEWEHYCVDCQMAEKGLIPPRPRYEP